MNALPVSHPSETLGVQLRASMPALEKGEARMNELGKKSYLFYSVGVSYKTTATVFAVA